MPSPTPIHRLAIVNRGEAAMRCIRAVKALRAVEGCDLTCIALYTDPDRNSPFVRHADRAVRLPISTTAVAAYLDHDLLLDVLARQRADAVWAGWGFVAEDPDFAGRVHASGMCFLGPSGETMRRLGDKIAAKQLAERVGVPVTAWNGGPLIDAEEAARAADRLGYPLALKAAAGGGGRGIRMVDSPSELAGAFASAASEAGAAFGDCRLFVERRIEAGRHIEVQIAADTFGHVISLGCRDCSVQRRHQKILEEAPPPGLDANLTGRLETAAVQLAREVGYQGVGTVEFLVKDGAYFFLEMNPRLQVEHGITEAVTGVDLVQLQIRIARNEPLPPTQSQPRGVAIEARICAEDPDAGFLPSPGTIVRFDPSLGPHIRVDTGVTVGTTVPADFDSLIAKVIATGSDRKEARGRLISALADFDLAVKGGTTNKGFLLELLETPEYRAAAVDTDWLDRSPSKRAGRAAFAAEALICAAILIYQNNRRAARLNFYADTTNASPARVPASFGQKIELSYDGDRYEPHVFAIGYGSYRVHLDGAVVAATLSEAGNHAATLLLADTTHRVVFDLGEAALRVEIDGMPYRFERQDAGQVQAGAPSLVVAVHVKPGDSVAVGQPLGLLEAMKMEIAFHAPIAGVVKEVRVGKGQQVAAGDVLLTIDPPQDTDAGEKSGRASTGTRIAMPPQDDVLDILCAAVSHGKQSVSRIQDADRLRPAVQQAAIDGLCTEVRRVVLGYDANPERVERIISLLESPLPDELSEGFRRQLAKIRRELVVFADIERLFSRKPEPAGPDPAGPSDSARLHTYVRRMRAGGAGIPDPFLHRLRRALAHYGITDLAYSDALERSVFRLFASQAAPELRRRLVMAVVRHVLSLARSGLDFSDDAELASALWGIAELRGLVAPGLADLVIEAGYVIFDGPELTREAEHTTKRVEQWLAAAESQPDPPPDAVLSYLADAPRGVFDRVGTWISDADPRRHAIALAAHLRRLYTPATATVHTSEDRNGTRIDTLRFADGRIVLGASAPAGRVGPTVAALRDAAAGLSANSGQPPVHALELLVAGDSEEKIGPLAEQASAVLATGLPAGRFTVSLLRPNGRHVHRTLTPSESGPPTELRLHGLHPETARRIDLNRLSAFRLGRLESEEGIYCFYGRSRAVPDDERIFVLADVRERAPDESAGQPLPFAAFQRAFHDATRTLRAILGLGDRRQRLHWNRISLFVAHDISIEPEMAERLSRRLEPTTRHLGLEKVVVRFNLIDHRGGGAARPVEIVISDLSGSRMEIDWRAPHREPLRPANAYERRVMAARRRGSIYPYEIIRMLTSDRPNGKRQTEIPAGRFQEYDLRDGATEPTAVAVGEREYGANRSAIVFGIMTTPTGKVPEGIRRVMILSDPTRGMGALAAPECDRILAALDLAERLSLPVEWLPVSSGARIAMDSGTENLDATARVVRRIVTFTQNKGVIHLVILGVNVGAQSYFDALSSMLMHTRGISIMTPGASMVLTGRAALEASGSIAAEDEIAIGGFERVMGPNGEAQFFARDLAEAYRILYEHYRYTYVVPGEHRPRPFESKDPAERSITDFPYQGEGEQDFRTVGDVFSDATNPGRKRPFAMRAVMRAVIDQDGGSLERWRSWSGADTAIVWDAHIGGVPVCLIGIESRNLAREGYRPLDGPETWSGGTLFPLSSKKIARALNSASGNRPAVVLANLSGFDGSPESMRKLQLEYGAEIARAVVNFRGPILFVVVSRYHGGAYVVFSQALNEELHAYALTGSYASVIGGAPAAKVVFAREVRGRTLEDPRVAALQAALRVQPTPTTRAALDQVMRDVLLEKQAEVAAEFDAVHTVQRARDVGSLTAIIEPGEIRAHLTRRLRSR